MIALFNLVFIFGDLKYCHCFLKLRFSFSLSFIIVDVVIWRSVESPDGVEFHAACWILELKYSTVCIMSFWSFKGICVFNIVLTWSRKSCQFVLLLCSTQSCVFLTTLLLTLIIMGEWSEDSSKLDLIVKYVFAILLMTPKSIMSSFYLLASMLAYFVIWFLVACLWWFYKVFCL